MYRHLLGALNAGAFAWQGVGEREMNAGEAPVIGMTDTFYAPGTYQLDVRAHRCHLAGDLGFPSRCPCGRKSLWAADHVPRKQAGGCAAARKDSEEPTLVTAVAFSGWCMPSLLCHRSYQRIHPCWPCCSKKVSRAQLPCPRTRTTATVHLRMRDGQGQVFEDAFALSFHVQFHRLLKWLVAAPVVACALALLAASAQDDARPALPSFRRLGMLSP